MQCWVEASAKTWGWGSEKTYVRVWQKHVVEEQTKNNSSLELPAITARADLALSCVTVSDEIKSEEHESVSALHSEWESASEANLS